MNRWFILNCLLLIFALWTIFKGHGGVHIYVGGLGLLFILYNWTRHAVFSTIRSNISRERKIKFAQLSKRVLPYHRWTGTTAFILIVIHVILVIKVFGFQIHNIKFLSGLIAGLTLLAVVTTGWMRLFRPSHLKRMFHLRLGLTLFFAIIIHLIL